MISLLRLEITDFSLFQAEVDKVEKEIDFDETDGIWNKEFWRVALDCRKKRKKLPQVLKLLNETYADESVSNLAFLRWELIDRTRFAELLKDIEWKFDPELDGSLDSRECLKLLDLIAQVKQNFQKPDGETEVREAPILMQIPMWILTGAIVFFGVQTSLTVGVARQAAEWLLRGAP